MEIKNMFYSSERPSYKNEEEDNNMSKEKLNFNLTSKIEHGDDNNCPTFYLRNNTNDVGLSLRLFRNLFMEAFNYNRKIDYERRGESQNDFCTSLEHISKLSMETNQSDIYIIGHISNLVER